MIMITSNFIFNFINFRVIVSFLTKLLTLVTLFSTAPSVLLVTKLVKLGISLLTALREALVTKLVILGISPLTSFILALRIVLVAKLVFYFQYFWF